MHYCGSKIGVNQSLVCPVNQEMQNSEDSIPDLSANDKEMIPRPFPWATNRRATIQSLEYLLQNNITSVRGLVECKMCKKKFEMKLDVVTKLGELLVFIDKKKESMHGKAPMEWLHPVLPNCDHCGRQNSVSPHIWKTKKRAMNWLFLLLAETLGCCSLKSLKYIVKHTKGYRTGAKDRILYSAYIALCKQLLPHFSLTTPLTAYLNLLNRPRL